MIANRTSSILKFIRENQATKSTVTVVWTGSAVLNPLALTWPKVDSDGNSVDSLDMLKQTVTGLRSQVDGLSAAIGRIRFENGSIAMKAVDTRPLEDGSTCPSDPSSGLRGNLSGRVTFSRRF